MANFATNEVERMRGTGRAFLTFAFFVLLTSALLLPFIEAAVQIKPIINQISDQRATREDEYVVASSRIANPAIEDDEAGGVVYKGRRISADEVRQIREYWNEWIRNRKDTKKPSGLLSMSKPNAGSPPPSARWMSLMKDTIANMTIPGIFFNYLLSPKNILFFE